MERYTWRLYQRLALVALLVHLSCQQTGNVPNSPLWNGFVQGLSAQTGRTVSDLNLLGLDDPTIRMLWKSYSENMKALLAQQETQQQASAPVVAAPITTTPPPIPSLYQNSYSFASTNQQQQQQQQPQTSGGSGTQDAGTSSGGNSDIYSVLLNMINQPGATTANSPPKTSTSTQDVMAAYQTFLGGNPTGNTGTIPTDAYTNMLQQYATLTGGQDPSQTTPTTSSNDISTLLQQMGGVAAPSTSAATDPNQISYQSLVDQYQSLMNPSSTSASTSTQAATNPSGASTPYDDLVAQYQQIMAQSAGTPAATSSSTEATNPSTPASTGSSQSYQSLVDQYTKLMGSVSGASASMSNSVSTSTNDQMLQLYQQMMSQATSTDTSSQTPTSSQPTASPSPPASDPTAFEQQLQTFFPQFTNLFAANASDPAANNQTDAQSTNKAQAIFDTLLFGNSQTESSSSQTSPTSSNATQPTLPQPTAPQPTPPQSIGLMQALQKSYSSGGPGGSILVDHMNNVFKARASRDMGCRFLPELLELDVIPTAPINCMHKCPLPYINEQRFGVYCLCCPPGINNDVANIMSIFKRASYMETPFTVTT